MKKFLQLLLVFGLFSFASCGPSAEEKAKMEQEAGEAVDSMMNALEAEMGSGSDSTPATENAAKEEQTTTKESEEAPKK